MHAVRGVRRCVRGRCRRLLLPPRLRRLIRLPLRGAPLLLLVLRLVCAHLRVQPLLPEPQRLVHP